MPETSVNKQCDPVPTENEIGAARQTCAAQSVAETFRVKESPNRKFELGIGRANARHLCGALFGREDVCQ